MSKLSKFMHSLNPEEAAKLLSRLIGEDVSTKDLEHLHSNDWLNTRANCFATIVRLKPALDEEAHALQVDHGRYILEEDKDCGLCLAINLPMDMVDLMGFGRAFVLRDAEGGFYALRDNETGLYLNDTSDNLPYFDECLIEPSDIFKIAEKANNNDELSPARNRVKKNENTVSDVDLYNFTPGGDHQVKPRMSISTLETQEPPSFVMAVAALVEIATNGDKKKRNQSSLIDDILDNYKFRGLSKSNLEKMFSQANRALTAARAAKD